MEVLQWITKLCINVDKSFDDVVGQTHVTKTLRNAISKGKQSHAYIGGEELGKRVSQRCLQRQLIVLTVMMENLVMNECDL